MSLPTDPAQRHRAVAAKFGEVVDAVTDWGAATPVPEWRAADVVDHLTTWLPGLLGSVRVALPGPGAEGSDPATRWHAQAVAVQALLDDPASHDTQVESPHFPAMSLAAMIDRLYTTDVFMHTWDLARATGHPAELDPQHSQELLEGMRGMEDVLRASGQYGPAVPAPADAAPGEALMAFVGRDPAWAPSG